MVVVMDVGGIARWHLNVVLDKVVFESAVAYCGGMS